MDRIGRTRRWASTAARNLVEAVTYPFESWPGTIGLVGVTGATYVLLVLASMPEYTLQMLGDGIHWFDTVIVDLTDTIYRTDGAVGLGIVVSYALLTGVAVVNAVAQLRLVGLGGLTDLTGVLPGLLASGCASCGAGLLGFLGFAGGLAVLPYDGALVRIGGLALLLFFLGRAGHPERCVVSPGVTDG
ncbi:hypothetical protein Halru_2918 [Halovivax ruber XH-70]|uniref:Uncharacterized protein n=1 Tax=Halovivax ruber (strain DSM 18193 / JCM 13892 / XH-70) TaxID=797302 RepID=L0IF73_HALRX|nr:hypothetical protein [Halovivax ruber]AGB17488.1 hypothetical protein Halru_2918 [Halovivax ruber XH-70]